MAEVTYPCYWQKKDNGGHWYWIYYARNGEEIARSSESYVNRSDCEHSIELLKNSKNDKVFVSAPASTVFPAELETPKLRR